MKKIYFIILALIYATRGFAQLGAGDIAFVAFNADGVKDIAFVTLTSITSGTVIYFTDNEWNGTAFNDTNEGELTWTANSDLDAGTVVVLSSVDASISANHGVISGSGFNPTGSNEAVFAFVGSDDTTPTSFLAAFSNDLSGSGAVLTGTGLTLGTDAIDFANDNDGYAYSGSRSGVADFSDFLTLINNTSNWIDTDEDGTLILPIDVTSFTLAGTQLVGFDHPEGSETETDATFEVLIPVTLANYGDTQVDLSVSVSGGTADAADYTLNTSSLSFTADGSQNISIDINDDADDASETVEITIAETSSTGILISPATFVLTIEDDDVAELVITEIMYDPDGTDTDFEYFEIYNAGATTVDLDGYSVSDAVNMTFTTGDEIAADEYIIVASTAASYSGNGYQVFEWSSGSLINTGETITLKNASDASVDAVTYTDDLAYSKGDGGSLSLGDFNADNANMENWIASAAIGGTPGAANDVTVWTGAASLEWLNTGNWSNGTPSGNLSAIIPSSGTSPTIADDIEVSSLRAATNTVLLISAGTTVVNNELILDGEAEVLSGASLAILGDETGSGSLTVFRNTTGDGGYSILGSPVSGVALTSMNADYLYSYDEGTMSYTIPTGDMPSGMGYFVGYNATSPSVSFTGSPNSGTESVLVTNTDITGDGFNLVANPYAAAISTSAFISANSPSVIDGTVYLWDDGGTNEGAKRGGDYITVNSIGETGTVDLPGTGALGETPASSGVITSTQGFYVHAVATADVLFTSDMQVTTTGANSDANHYREASETQLVRLAISGNDLYNEILIGLTDNATLAFDNGLDALKLSGNELISFYSFLESEKLAIQALPKVNTAEVNIQLGFDLAEAGEYELKLASLEGVSEDLDVLIYDKVTGHTYDLRESASIAFTNSASVVASERFSLVLAPAAVLGFENAKSNFNVFTNERGLNIVTEEAFDNAEVKIFTLDGKVVSQFQDVDFSSQAWNTPFSRHGLFIVSIESKNGLLIKKFLN
ncbi:MAG: lamin tail domain-containing protein [Cyclobacteriaceae bacterium]